MQVRQLGMVPYHETFDAMRALTASRDSNSEDILWLCEHPSVYTLGVAALPAHILDAGITPVVTTDRGGQVTYHGPGQAVAYPLIDLRKRNYFIKEYVFRLEESVIRTLCDYAITGHRIVGAPGIYVSLDSPHSHRRLRNDRSSLPSSIQFRGLGKISALGIKVSKHCTYHGASLNVAMDLEPFSRINPCGYAGLKTIDLSTISGPISLPDVMQCWESHLQQLLG